MFWKKLLQRFGIAVGGIIFLILLDMSIYGIDSDTLVKLWSQGYKVIPFLNWGAAESILVDRESGEFIGVNDTRKIAGQAVSF